MDTVQASQAKISLVRFLVSTAGGGGYIFTQNDNAERFWIIAV